MNQRVLLLSFALLLFAFAAYMLATRDEDGPAPPPTRSTQPEPDATVPGLRAEGKAPAQPAEPAPAPTEDDWLRTWDPADGIPMGDDTLRGVVVDLAGKPVFDARLYLRTKQGQPNLIDAPSTWETRSDADGKWQIEMAYASRSLLGAWAPGYERIYIDELDAEAELRVVLEPAPELTVTVKAPPTRTRPGFRVEEPLEDARLRIRLSPEKAHEHPRPGEALLAEWDQLVETDKPALLRIPYGVPAHITADAPNLASDPAFVALPVPAKSIVFQLVPSKGIRMRLLDAKTKAVLPLGEGGWGFTRVTHMASGFELESAWRYAAIWHERGITSGQYRIDLRYRGYVDPLSLRVVELSESDKRVDVDVLLERDMKHGTLHLLLQHVATSQHAGQPVQHGLTLIRRREDKPPLWRHVGGMSWMLDDGRMKRTLENLPAGTYDVLAWDGSRFPPVGHLVGRKVEGGTEKTVDVTLREGYGFRPADALGGTGDGSARMRAQSELLGALPWVAWMGELSLFQTDPQGFADAPTMGYIGPYPSKQITLVEQPKGGKASTHALKPSISPPR